MLLREEHVLNMQALRVGQWRCPVRVLIRRKNPSMKHKWTPAGHGRIVRSVCPQLLLEVFVALRLAAIGLDL